ncbi:MAG: AAA family ATPase [Prevotella sp.]|nr:AAA family ATPase [Prevotella sp.]
MNENVMSQLDAELEHAGEETALSPQMLLLEQLRITPEKQLKPMEFLFRLFGKPCFPRRELVAITGKAKSGKTFVTSMLMACCQVNEVLAFQRMREEPLHVLWYDTEQSDESTQDILKNRVITMIKATDQTTPYPILCKQSVPKGRAPEQSSPTRSLSYSGGEFPECDIFNVRAVEWKQRRALLLEAIKRCKPDLVIVDGIRDLVNDINDGVLAQEVMEELLHLATQHDCCIVCVLHQNKSGEDHNLRGWIGTELMNKAFEVYSCEKLLPQRIFSLEQTLTRKYDIEQTMYFEVGDDGLPRGASPLPPSLEGDKRGGQEPLPKLNQEYIVHEEDGGWHIDLRRLIGDVMAGRDYIYGSEMKELTCKLANISSWKFYNKLLTEAIDERIIQKSNDHEGRVIYAMAPF